MFESASCFAFRTPEAFTQLTDFDIGRVVAAAIPGRARYERRPATFDSNGNRRQSQRPLGLPATMVHNDKTYVLVYKSKYRLQGERADGPWMIHNGLYKATYVNKKKGGSRGRSKL